MTTKSTQIAGVTFTKRVSKAKIPYYDQCSGFYLFGPNEAVSLVNQISGQPALTKVGAPAYGAAYATIGAADGFDTHLLMDSPYTFCAIANHSVGGGGSIICRQAGAEAFIGMLRYGNGPSFTLDTWPNGAQAGGFDNLQTPNFRFVGSFWGGTGHPSGFFAGDPSGRGGLLYSFGSTNLTHTVTPTLNLRFGAGGNWGAGNTAQLAMGALYPFEMTQPQVREVLTRMKALAVARGLAMV